MPGINFIRRLAFFFRERDVLFLLHEKISLFIGFLFIRINLFVYGDRFSIDESSKVWGRMFILIHGAGSVSIGKNFHAVSNTRRSFITLYSRCHLTIIDDGEIVIGDHVGLNGTAITAKSKISIGDNSMVGPNTIIIDHDGHNSWPPETRWTTPGAVSNITIEDNVWIGMNCLILKGVKIGSGSIVGAGSVVVSDVEKNCLYAGNPAKKIRSLM